MAQAAARRTAVARMTGMTTKPRRRLLTIGHSYAVALNRRLPNELARLGGWDVTAAGPARFQGDFGWHTLQPEADESCTAVPVPVHFSRRIHVMLYGRELAKLLAQPWDLVHCWEEPYIAAALQVARRVDSKVPLVFATFQNISKRYPPPFNWIERHSLRRADGMVAFGRTTANVLDGRGCDCPVAIIPPGVDVDEFRPDHARRAATLNSLGWREGVPVVGFLGRFVPEKGIEMLIEALDRVATPWRALFVGSGPLEPMLSAWARSHDNQVRIVTNAQHADVPAYLNAMDLLCAPSITTARWREQFGRMLIEAFASGVAVIGSSSGEIPNVIAEAGLVMPEGDAVRWGQAIELLTADRARRCDLARRGRERAEAVYGWPTVAKQHIEFFERVIAERQR
jgi:glycosyltransferase involved in cell wall biosynthesis